MEELEYSYIKAAVGTRTHGTVQRTNVFMCKKQINVVKCRNLIKINGTYLMCCIRCGHWTQYFRVTKLAMDIVFIFICFNFITEIRCFLGIGHDE